MAKKYKISSVDFENDEDEDIQDDLASEALKTFISLKQKKFVKKAMADKRAGKKTVDDDMCAREDAIKIKNISRWLIDASSLANSLDACIAKIRANNASEDYNISDADLTNLMSEIANIADLVHEKYSEMAKCLNMSVKDFRAVAPLQKISGIAKRKA